jgi:hypothetical protein
MRTAPGSLLDGRRPVGLLISPSSASADQDVSVLADFDFPLNCVLQKSEPKEICSFPPVLTTPACRNSIQNRIVALEAITAS